MTSCVQLHGTDQQKLAWLFTLYDVDRQGYIYSENLTRVVQVEHGYIYVYTCAGGHGHIIYMYMDIYLYVYIYIYIFFFFFFFFFFFLNNFIILI